MMKKRLDAVRIHPTCLESLQTLFLIRIEYICHTATHCNTLHRAATHCNMLQHATTRCNTLGKTATRCNTLNNIATHCNTLMCLVHDTFIHVCQNSSTAHAHVRVQSCVWSWLIHMCDGTHSWLVRMFDMTHSWNIHMFYVTHS